MKTTQKSLKKITSPIRKWLKSRRGWALIMIAYFLFLISVVALAGPIGSTTKQLYDVSFEQAVSRAENMAIAASSPIRKQIVDATYKKIQEQLIQHLQQDQGSINYVCGDTIAVPKSSGGSMENQYGLCLPENFYFDLLGDTNKSIDFIGTFYPNYKTPLADPVNENARKSFILQLQNKYDYTIRGYFVGKYVLSQGVTSGTDATRVEEYRWKVRADIILTTGSVYGDLNKDLVVYYDVVVTNSYFPGNFLGAGSACDQQSTVQALCGTDTATGEAIPCTATVYISPDGNHGPVSAGGDSSSSFDIIGNCVETGIRTKRCQTANGGFVEVSPLRSARRQQGCASIRSGVPGATGPDPGGYSFSIIVRISSIGNSYN